MKQTKVNADVKISPTLKDSVKKKAGEYNCSYADMFRLFLILGQASFNVLVKSGQDINDLLNDIKEEKGSE